MRIWKLNIGIIKKKENLRILFFLFKGVQGT